MPYTGRIMKYKPFISSICCLGVALALAVPAGAQSVNAAGNPKDSALISSPTSAGPADKASSQRLEAFQTVLRSIPTYKTSFLNHPLERFLYESITRFNSQPDTMNYLNLCQRVDELKGKATSALIGATYSKFEEALELAYGFYRIGYETEAMMWLIQVDRLTVDAEFRIRARQLIIFHSVVSRNAELLVELNEDWDSHLLSYKEGKDAAVSLMSALYTLGEDLTLVQLLDKIPGPEPYKSFFSALVLADQGDYRNATRFLPKLLSKSAVQAPVNYRYAALMLAARIEHKGGSAAIANREYRLLAEQKTGYVKDWALQELANQSWQAGRTQNTQDIFNQLCDSKAEGIWKPLSCRLSEYLTKYRDSQEGAD